MSQRKEKEKEKERKERKRKEERKKGKKERKRERERKRKDQVESTDLSLDTIDSRLVSFVDARNILLCESKAEFIVHNNVPLARMFIQIICRY